MQKEHSSHNKTLAKPESAPFAVLESYDQEDSLPDFDISWSASEYIAHHKSWQWYLLLAAAAAAVASAIYFFTKDTVAVIMIAAAFLAFGVFAARHPRELQYRMNKEGLQIENKFYPYQIFKSFSLQQDGPLVSVVLLPLRRFMPAISMYYPLDQRDEILNMLSRFLPYEERPTDFVESLMSKIRF